MTLLGSPVQTGLIFGGKLVTSVKRIDGDGIRDGSTSVQVVDGKGNVGNGWFPGDSNTSAGEALSDAIRDADKKAGKR